MDRVIEQLLRTHAHAKGRRTRTSWPRSAVPRVLAALVTALALGVASAAPTAFVPLGSGNRVIAVDVASSKIVKSFGGILNPHGLVATPDGEYLVAGSLSETELPANATETTPNSKLYVIHPVHGHVMSEVGVPGWTHHQAVTPDGRYVISTHPTREGITVVDLAASRLVHTIRTGQVPNYAIVARDGATAYVSNTGDGTISVVDLKTWKVTRTLDAGVGPEHLVFAADGKTIYAANSHLGAVSKVAIASGRVERSYKIGKRVHGLDLGDDGRTLFVTDRADARLVAVDVETGAQRVLALGPEPYHLNTIAGTGKVYVSSATAPRIWVVDQKTLTVSNTIEFGSGEGHQVAVVK